MLKKKEREKLIFEINITPLTDVMLVLLIIFMVTTPFIIKGNIKINLPSAKAAPEKLPEKDIVVGITEDGKVYLNGERVNSDEELYEGVSALVKETGSRRVIIEGDKMAFHGEMVKAMSVVKDAGADKIAITTIPGREKEGLFKK